MESEQYKSVAVSDDESAEGADQDETKNKSEQYGAVSDDEADDDVSVEDVAKVEDDDAITDFSEDIDSILVRKNVLGQGAYGLVYKGLPNPEIIEKSKHLKLNQVVAVKEQFISDESDRKYLFQHVTQQLTPTDLVPPIATEIRALRKVVRHGCGDNVAKLYDVFYNVNTTKMYYIMEFIDGLDLSVVEKTLNLLRHIRLGNITETDIMKHMVYPLLSGLVCMHLAGIAHRDIKADNMMLSRDTGTAKWIDFGLSCVDTCRKLKTIHNSGNAPEVAWANKNLDKTKLNTWTTADLWAFGCFLYRFIMGNTYPIQELVIKAKREKISVEQYVEQNALAATEVWLNPLSAFPKNEFPLIHDILNATLQIDPTKRAETWNAWLEQNMDKLDLTPTLPPVYQ